MGFLGKWMVFFSADEDTGDDMEERFNVQMGVFLEVDFGFLFEG